MTSKNKGHTTTKQASGTPRSCVMTDDPDSITRVRLNQLQNQSSRLTSWLPQTAMTDEAIRSLQIE
jgi:hypothetical protein